MPKRDMTMKHIDKIMNVKFINDYNFLTGNTRDGFIFSDSKRERYFIPVTGSKPSTKIPLNVLITMVNLSHDGYRFKWDKSTKKYNI